MAMNPAMMAAKLQELLEENAKVIQELGRENEGYKKRIDDLEKRVQALEAFVDLVNLASLK